MAVSPGGRLWANWYAGKTPGEDQNNYVVLSTSGDNGTTWREVLVVDPDGDGPVRTFDPELWMAPDGKLRLFWAQAQGHEATLGGVWCLQTAEPESEQPKWDKPVRVTDGVMMCKPLVLTTGEWVLPASTWRKTDHSAKMVVSTDQGKTWTIRGGCNVPVAARAFDEHMFVERKDGSLWLLARTNYGIGESVSTDRGVTWPELTPSAIAHPSARFFITRLSSGNLLLVKHGPIGKRTGRSHLTAFVSTDDGRTWGGGLLLDERDGVSYPDGQQTADGLIRIIYDYSRTGDRHILMATFREEDAAAGKAGQRRRASAPAGQPGFGRRASRSRRRWRPTRTASRCEGDARRARRRGAPPQALAVGETLFTDRSYVLSELPAALKGVRFLPVEDGRAEEAALQPRRHRLLPHSRTGPQQGQPNADVARPGVQEGRPAGSAPVQPVQHRQLLHAVSEGLRGGRHDHDGQVGRAPVLSSGTLTNGRWVRSPAPPPSEICTVRSPEA